MGSTAVVAVAQGNRISIAWLGDSRAYVVGKYGASQLTADANQAGERIVDWQRGILPQFDATGFALVRYIGHFDEAGEAEPIPPLHTELVLLPGERLVMCSDGVTDYCATGPAEVARVFTDVVPRSDVDSVARALVNGVG
jgi:serine/threonine protein phosphatase PrpC